MPRQCLVLGAGCLLAARFEASEDHAAGAGLEDAGYGDGDRFVDVRAARLDDHHGAIFEVADPLARFLSSLDDADLDLLARQDFNFNCFLYTLH